MPHRIARLDLVVFAVGGLRCALRREEVDELLPLPRLVRPPNAPGVVAGFFNLGGRPVPALDAAGLLGAAAAAGAPGVPAIYRHLVLLRAGFALLVDRVTDVITVPEAEISRLADGETLNGCVVGVVEDRDGPIHLVAADRLLLARERAQLSALLDLAAERMADWQAGP